MNIDHHLHPVVITPKNQIGNKLTSDWWEAFEALDKAPLVSTKYLMSELDYQDIVKYSSIK